MSAAIPHGGPADIAAVPRLADHLTGRPAHELANPPHARAHPDDQAAPTSQTCRAQATAIFHDAACRHLHKRAVETRLDAPSGCAAHRQRLPGPAKHARADALASEIAGRYALLSRAGS